MAILLKFKFEKSTRIAPNFNISAKTFLHYSFLKHLNPK